MNSSSYKLIDGIDVYIVDLPAHLIYNTDKICIYSVVQKY